MLANILVPLNTKKTTERPGTEKEQTLLTSLPTKSEFNTDSCEALMTANIPLNKLSNSKFREFLEKYTDKNIRSI